MEAQASRPRLPVGFPNGSKGTYGRARLLPADEDGSVRIAAVASPEAAVSVLQDRGSAGVRRAACHAR